MNNTSYTYNTSYNNNIDFDEASKAWRRNKISLGEGSFRYRCIAKTKEGKMCKNKPKRDYDHCHVHSHLNT